MKTKKMMISLISGTLAAVMACGGALAASVRTTTDVNMRAKPDNSAAVLCVLPKNAEAEKLGMEGNWYHLSYKDKDGYVYKKYIKDDETATPAAETKTVYTTGDLYVRAKPDKTSAKLGVLKKGTAVETTGLKNGWYTIKYNGKIGYISAKYTTETKPEVKPTTTTVYTTGDLYVRAKPDKTSTKLGVLKKGTAVETTGLKNGWYTIKYNGKTGYISAKYTTTTKPETAAKKVVYTSANLNVRDKASTDGKKLGVLKKGTAVETTGLKNGWYTIKYNGKTAYISAKYTTEVKPGTAKPTTPTTKTVYTTSDLNVRAEPNKNAKKLGVLKKGAEVKTITLKNGWYSIAYNGKTGYISAKYTTDKR